VGSVSSKARRVLTPKEIDEKRANNMCFFCDEKYFPGYKCSSQVYRFEVVEGEEWEEVKKNYWGKLLLMKLQKKHNHLCLYRLYMA